MVDLPGRPAWEPEDRADTPDDEPEAVQDGGWGSPVPAEYGSLHALHPPIRRQEVGLPAGGLFSAWARVSTRRPGEENAGPAVPAPDAGPSERDGAEGRPAESARLFRWPPDAGSRPEADGVPQSGAIPGRALHEAVRQPEPVVRPEPAWRPEPAYRSEPAWRPEQPAPVAPAYRPEPAMRSDPAARTAAIPVTEPAPWRPDPERQVDRPGLRPGDQGRADQAPAGATPPGPTLPDVAAAGTSLAGADMPGPDDPAGVRPAPPLRRPVRRPGRARNRVVVRHIDVATVAKVSVLFWLLTLVVIVVAAVLLWVAADVFGTLPSIDKSIRTLFSLRKFELHPGAVAMYTAAAGVVIAVVGTLASILLTLIYNLIADVVGGIRVELESFGRD